MPGSMPGRFVRKKVGMGSMLGSGEAKKLDPENTGSMRGCLSLMSCSKAKEDGRMMRHGATVGVGSRPRRSPAAALASARSTDAMEDLLGPRSTSARAGKRIEISDALCLGKG